MCIRPSRVGFGFRVEGVSWSYFEDSDPERACFPSRRVEGAASWCSENLFDTCEGFEKRLCTQFQSHVVSLGEVLCCDKLFRFTGMGGVVRKVPSKPARLGIWHYYQGVLTLPMGIRYLCIRALTISRPIWGRARKRLRLWENGLT